MAREAEGYPPEDSTIEYNGRRYLIKYHDVRALSEDWTKTPHLSLLVQIELLGPVTPDPNEGRYDG